MDMIANCLSVCRLALKGSTEQQCCVKREPYVFKFVQTVQRHYSKWGFCGKNNAKENMHTQCSLHITPKCQDSIDILLISTFKGALYNIYNLPSFDAACPKTECNVLKRAENNQQKKENNHPQSSDSFESLPLCRNVYILVSFHPAGSEGFEVRSHFTPVTSVSVSLQAVSQLHQAKDSVQCLSAISQPCFILFFVTSWVGTLDIFNVLDQTQKI